MEQSRPVSQEETDLHTEWSDAQENVAAASRQLTLAKGLYDSAVDRVRKAQQAIDAWMLKQNENIPVDRNAKELIGGGDPNDPAHKERKPNGQQQDYVVLSAEERARGFVRPVRRSYIHVGKPAPQYPLRVLTPEENAQYIPFGYVQYEKYPDASTICGKFWTQEELDRVGKGCGQLTKMSQAIAETYARCPDYYGGTFCCGCGAHFPVGEHGEFVWADTKDERVGT